MPRYAPGIQVLYYIGDMGSYHPRAQKAARNLAEVLSKAKVSFGILGESEKCSGSEAFEVGEMGLFEEIVNSNVQLFKSLNVREIITLSPHSYNVMKNYYRFYGGEFTVKHYTQLIVEILNRGKLELKKKVDKTITFHDPCFLGRWNNEYEAPRHILETISTVKLVEMRRSKQNSLCCGGGSGNSYTGFGCGLLLQNEATPCRIRVREAYETGAEILAVACPSCLIMLEEAVREENLEDKILVKDITEIISQTL
ncbi:MAG: (Fe-S)-binding protein [Candidatus Bathyarchaeota archaeon]|nr:(Fe-S)-binding protein [Candidatus Bathyarchaeota archaeon]